MKTYPTFAAFQADQDARTRAILRALRAFVRDEAPDLVETVKWGNGCWVGDGGPVAFAHVEPDHVQFGFFDGAALDDPKGVLLGKAKFVRHVKVRAAGDIDRPTLSKLLRQAAG